MIADAITELIDRHNSAPERVKPHLAEMIAERVRKIDLKGLECKLDSQWKWLDDHTDHEKHFSREDRFLDELSRYQETVDVIHRADAVAGRVE